MTDPNKYLEKTLIITRIDDEEIIITRPKQKQKSLMSETKMSKFIIDTDFIN